MAASIDQRFRIFIGHSLLNRHLLAAVTVIMTIAAGAFHWVLYCSTLQRPHAGLWAPATLAHGLSFAAPLLIGLLAHEAAHRVLLRRYDVRSSHPILLPAPLLLTGTLGAFIKLYDPIPTRQALLRFAVAGPLTSFAIGVVTLLIGARWSAFNVPHGTFVRGFGQPLLLSFLGYHGGVVLHPTAIAGWLLMLFSWYSLLPFENLDGGRIVQALAPQWHARISFGVFVLAFAAATYLWSSGWTVAWLLMLGVFFVAGPADEPIDTVLVRLTAVDYTLAGAALVVFVLSWSRL